jgi:hypothetical protein
MQLLVTFLTVVGGLIFSIAVAVGVEEFIFRQIFGTFFAQPKSSPKPPVLTNCMVQPVRVRDAGSR